MTIKQLEYNDYKDQKYKTKILSDAYLAIEPAGDGVDIKWEENFKFEFVRLEYGVY